MIKCPFCGTVHPENTLFCEECGSYLTSGTSQATDPLSDHVASEEEREHASESAFVTLVLAIEDGSRIELVLGRLDASRAIFPDVDLTGEQGIEKGISRRHARISRRGKQVLIEDLNSLNGTFLNANRLAPELPYPLKSGDQVQLGKLLLTVHLK
jgi:hypothetical protein